MGLDSRLDIKEEKNSEHEDKNNRNFKMKQNF